MFPGCGVALLPARPVDLRARGEGVVEYPGKVACPSGRRCSTRNAVWCHSHPGFKSQRYRHCRPAPLGPGGFVMPTWRVWGACGPDRSPAAARCVGRPGCLWPRWCSGRRRARPPARLGDLTSFGAAPRSPPVPSGPSGALHTSGARRGFGVSVRVPPNLWLPQLTLTNFARNSPATVSNLEFISLELQGFWGVLKNGLDKLRAKFGCRWGSRRPWVSRVGGAGEVSRWFETAIAFAGEKWAFLVQFSGVEVMAVSTVPCWGRAVVSLVSSSPCFCVLCAIFVALLRLM